MSDFQRTGIELVAENYDNFMRSISTANTAVTNFGDQAAGAKSSSFETMWSGALSRVGGLAVEQFAKAGQAVFGFIQQAPQLAADFQDKINLFASLSGASEDTTQEINDLAISLGQKLPVSTADVGDALNELTKGGIDPATLAAGGLESSINFATSSQLGLAQAAEIVAKQLGTFAPVGATAAEKAALMTTQMDLMTKVANASTVDVAELSNGLLQAGGTANTVGLDYQQFVTTMGVLAPGFNSASEAGTSFKNFLLRLSPSTKSANDAMESLGLSSFDAAKAQQFLAQKGIDVTGKSVLQVQGIFAQYLKDQGASASAIEKLTRTEFTLNSFYDEKTGKLKSVAEISQTLQDATKNLTDQERAQAFQQIFGNDAMNAASLLARQGAQGYNDFAAAVGTANGVQGQAEATQKGANFAFTNFQGTLEAIQITLGQKVLPYQERFFAGLNDLSTAGLNLIKALEGDEDAFFSLSEPMQNVYRGIATMQFAFDTFMRAIGGDDVSESLARMPLWLQNIVTSGVRLTNWFRDVGTVISTTFAPYIPIVTTAFNELIAAFGMFGQTGSSTMDIWQILGDVLKRTIQAVINVFMLFAITAIDVAKFIVQGVAILVNGFVWLYDRVNQYINGTRDIWTDLGNFLSNLYNSMWEITKTVWKNILYSIGYAVGAIYRSVVDTFQKAYDWVIGLFTTWGPDLIKQFATFVTLLPQNLPIWWNQIKNWFSKLWAPSNLGVDTGQGIIDGLIDGIEKNWDRFATFFTGLVKGVWDAFIKGLTAGASSGSGSNSGSGSGGSGSGGTSSGSSVRIPSSVARVAGVATQTTINYYNTSTSSNAYNLGVTTAAQSRDVISQFTIMQAMV